jgi:hypothetical protein
MQPLKITRLSSATQLSLLAIVILMGAIFFTVNTALQSQTSSSSHASTAGITSGHTYRLENQCNSTLYANVSDNTIYNAPIILKTWVSGGGNQDR